MSMSRIVEHAIIKVAKKPEEFISPGIGKAREIYKVLKELYDGLAERLESGSVKFPYSLNCVNRELIGMERNLIEASDGYSLNYERYASDNVDSILNSLAFVDKYFAPKRL